MNRTLVIATRGSDLAIWQSRFIQSQLHDIGVSSELLIVKTTGDEVQHLSFDKMEGKGFFTHEIEQALRRKQADLAVHSYKDLETDQPAGLVVAAVSERAAAADLLIMLPSAQDEGNVLGLKNKTRVGTSSVRRKSQVHAARPDLVLSDLRGNVPTRVKKLRNGDYGAIILAKAGIDRLEFDLSGLICRELPPDEFVPAPAQGFLAVQCRDDDQELLEILHRVNHEKSAQISNIERSVLNGLGGGCHVPLGVYARKELDEFVVEVAYSPEFGQPLRHLSFIGDQQEALVTMIVNELKIR